MLGWLALAAGLPGTASALGGDMGYGGGYGGGIVCNTTVNLANCQVYLTQDTYCESLVHQQCQELVSEAHATERATIAEARNVLPHDEMTSNTTVSAKYIKDKRTNHYLNGVDGLYVANNISTDLGVAKQDQSSRLNSMLNSPCTTAAAAAGNPNKICSCGQYAYDTYYSARAFERKVAENALDYRKLFQEAYSLANANIVSKDALHQTSMVPHQDARSRFHALDTWALSGQYPPNADKHVWDPALRAAYDNTYKTHLLSWAKHMSLSESLKTIPDEKLNYLFDQQQQFADLLAHRNARWATYQAKVVGLPTGGAEFQQLASVASAELKALDAQLEAGLRRGRDELGCVPANINDVNACDWSPKYFYSDAQRFLSKLGEDRYQQCVQLTGDYFGNAAPTALNNSLNFANFLTTENNSERKLGAVTSDIDDSPTLGQQFSDDGRYGNDDFNVQYGYGFSWGITDYDKVDANNNPLYCKSNLRGGGTFSVDGTVFGVTKDVVDFETWAYTKTEENAKDYLHEELSMQILGMHLFTPINAKQEANYTFVSTPSKTLGKDGQGYSMSKTFIVVAVPVTVKGGLTGTFGVDINLQAGIIRDCDNTPDTMNIGVSSDVKPYVDLDAYVSAGVGWSGLSAGVKGEVNLLEAELPFKAKAGLEFLGTNTGADLFLVAKADLDLKLQTLDGKVSVYVEYIVGSSEKEIFSWPGYELKSELFDFDAKYPLVQVAHIPTT